MLTSKQRRLSLGAVFFTFFVDNLAWSIVFPIFAPYFMDINNQLFSSSVDIGTRTAILSIFLASYPLAQFFGAPMIGEYADRAGRRKALTYTIFLAGIGLVLSAVSIHNNWLVLLFISRLISGVFSGNLSICMTAIADLNIEEEHRVKNFGYLAVVAGFSFILGAFLGGKCSDPKVSDIFSPAFPFWIGVILMGFNWLFVLFFFKETTHHVHKAKFVFFESINNITKVFKIKRLTTLYLIYFLFLFSWNILFQFTPVLVIDYFQFTNSEIGNMAAFMGVCWALGSGVFNKFLLKFFKGIKILEFAILFFAFLTSFIALINNVSLLIAVLGISIICSGIAWPLCSNLISSKAGENMRGKVMGMSQSMQSLAMALSPLIGFFIHLSIAIPFYVASLFSLCAGIFYFKLKK